MFRTIDEFISDWTAESAATEKILKSCDNAVFTVKPHEKIRSPQFLAWHIIQSIPEMMNRTGLTVAAGPAEPTDLPTADEAVRVYSQTARLLVDQIQAHWKDETLNDAHEMYGESWTNATTLRVLIQHEVHHRAQLTIVLRLLDQKIPGIYGPSAEEWSHYQMPIQP